MISDTIIIRDAGVFYVTKLSDYEFFFFFHIKHIGIFVILSVNVFDNHNHSIPWRKIHNLSNVDDKLFIWNYKYFIAYSYLLASDLKAMVSNLIMH